MKMQHCVGDLKNQNGQVWLNSTTVLLRGNFLVSKYSLVFLNLLLFPFIYGYTCIAVIWLKMKK